MISFNVDPHEAATIQKIARRAVALAIKYEIPYDMQSASMDLTACHANGTPLRLYDLLAAPDFNFAHDVLGIRRHIDRTTGMLGDCFVPRYALQDAERREREGGGK